MDTLVQTFDEELFALVEKKREISVELKYAELTMICFYEELQILQDTQEKEDELDGNLKTLEITLADIDGKVGKEISMTKSIGNIVVFNF